MILNGENKIYLLKCLTNLFLSVCLLLKKAYSIEMIGSADNKDQSRILKLLTNYKRTNLSTKKLSIYNLSYIQVKIFIKYIQSYYHNDSAIKKYQRFNFDIL